MGSINIFAEKKAKNEKISMLTCYDYSTAAIFNETDVDAILIGDSLGMVFQGNDSTLPVTIDDMIYHTRAVKRGAKDKCIVTDMPFLSYQISPQDAARNAGKIIKESGADAVKIEGGLEIIDEVKAIIKAKIPVLGHIGLTPQSVNVFGGFKVQAKNIDSAKKLIQDALALQEAGVFAITIECVPAKLATLLTNKLSIPTIGIGAGSGTSGQVLVINDMLGMFDKLKPKFVKQYVNMREIMIEALNNYANDVTNVTFPNEEHTFKIDDEIIEKLEKEF